MQDMKRKLPARLDEEVIRHMDVDIVTVQPSVDVKRNL